MDLFQTLLIAHLFMRYLYGKMICEIALRNSNNWLLFVFCDAQLRLFWGANK